MNSLKKTTLIGLEKKRKKRQSNHWNWAVVCRITAGLSSSVVTLCCAWEGPSMYPVTLNLMQKAEKVVLGVI